MSKTGKEPLASESSVWRTYGTTKSSGIFILYPLDIVVKR